MELTLNDHAAVATALVVVGIMAWLGAGYFAERATVDPFAQYDAPPPLDLPDDRPAHREEGERLVETSGKIMIGLGIIAFLALGARIYL